MLARVVDVAHDNYTKFHSELGGKKVAHYCFILKFTISIASSAVNSHGWILFLMLSPRACKISRMNAKHPAKHVKSHSSRKTLPFFIFLLVTFS